MPELQLNLTMLLPEIEAGDQCAHYLTERLAGVRGVELAHIVKSDSAAELCLHFDPNLVTVTDVSQGSFLTSTGRGLVLVPTRFGPDYARESAAALAYLRELAG